MAHLRPLPKPRRQRCDPPAATVRAFMLSLTEGEAVTLANVAEGVGCTDQDALSVLNQMEADGVARRGKPAGSGRWVFWTLTDTYLGPSFDEPPEGPFRFPA